MSKAAFVVGAGVGYVLGARAGKERYEQIKAQANRLWQDPRVREKATQAQDLVKENAPAVQHKVADAAGKATARVKDKASGGNNDAQPSGERVRDVPEQGQRG